ncbi:MAG: hypothetical protein FD165_1061 [Gammaproteobacteria bacterium]|nr:MAG: hypothetical protein FD165_1061 [Gammaproteobacteria bacterium]TND06231.1 MAG: hypothetical protein FD120_718 [Gammaproteobacteria bacterium]
MKKLTRSVMVMTLPILLPIGVYAESSHVHLADHAPLMLAAKSDDAKQELAAAVSKAARTFKVTVGPKTPAHMFFGKGKEIGFSVDGEESKELVLTRGVTYAFDVDTDIQHDFYLTTDEIGRGAGTVTDGVLGQFTFKGKVAFTPNQQTPGRMFYQCRNHMNMGGLMHVVSEGEKVTLEHKPGSASAVARPAEVSEADVKQKIAYAKMLTMSQSAKRVADSGHAEARAMMEQAKADLAASESALKGGNNSAAMESAMKAIDDANAAVGLVPKEGGDGVDHRIRYAELLGNLRNYKESYLQQYERKTKSKRSDSSSDLDPKTIQKMEDDAIALSTDGKYKEAADTLEKAQSMVTSALSQAFQGEAVVYDQKFKTPAEEYQFEVARYKGFADLVPLALEQKQPAENVVQLINTFVEKGKKIAGEAAGYAKKGDYETAIIGMQEATNQMQRALMTAGVR